MDRSFYCILNHIRNIFALVRLCCPCWSFVLRTRLENPNQGRSQITLMSVYCAEGLEAFSPPGGFKLQAFFTGSSNFPFLCTLVILTPGRPASDGGWLNI
ncbi:hypothetical protein DPEC_G00065800 [Dallia pectoralis]|uniref:Uncharacterized protein n=1 Tax=Dallia pectoralis TaxID=75939 RepID=A0ACC2H8X1_DALPE|nr:hypothetical protein DPEC_G00065800 [Dallia pectoralis]